MCLGGSKPDIPKPPPPPSEVGAATAARRQSRDRARVQAESGRQSTVLTGARGVAAPSVTRKTLLGQ